jgi:hypothetical protein
MRVDLTEPQITMLLQFIDQNGQAFLCTSAAFGDPQYRRMLAAVERRLLDALGKGRR